MSGLITNHFPFTFLAGFPPGSFDRIRSIVARTAHKKAHSQDNSEAWLKSDFLGIDAQLR